MKSEVKNIVILLRIFWTAAAQKIAIEEAKVLKTKGFKVTIIFLRGKVPDEYKEILNGVDHYIASETGNSLLSPVYDYITRLFRPDRSTESRVDFNMIKRFPKIAKKFEPDYVICHDQYSGLAGYYNLKKNGIPYCVIMHERPPDFEVPILGTIAKMYEKKTLKNAHKVYSMTESIAKSVEEVHGIETEVLNYAATAQEFIPFKEKNDSIIAVSMWDRGRYPEIYLKIISALPLSFTLFMVGNWREKSLLEEFRKKMTVMGLDKRVTLLSGLTETELVSIYRKSKFSLRFSFGEVGGGMSVFESVSCGVPVVVNRKLGSANFVESNGLGAVIKGGSPEDLDIRDITEFITQVNNEIEYRKLQDNCRKALANLSWEKHVETLVTDMVGKK